MRNTTKAQDAIALHTFDGMIARFIATTNAPEWEINALKSITEDKANIPMAMETMERIMTAYADRKDKTFADIFSNPTLLDEMANAIDDEYMTCMTQEGEADIDAAMKWKFTEWQRGYSPDYKNTYHKGEEGTTRETIQEHMIERPEWIKIMGQALTRHIMHGGGYLEHRKAAIAAWRLH